MRAIRGFSIFSMMIWGIIFGALGIYATAMWPVYSAYWKVQGTFDGVAKNLSELSEQDIRERLPKLLRTQYLNPKSLPAEFYDHLEIEADGEGYVKISSSYHVMVWFLGEPAVVESESGVTQPLSFVDQWRDKLNHMAEFRPYAESVMMRQNHEG